MHKPQEKYPTIRACKIVKKGTKQAIFVANTNIYIVKMEKVYAKNPKTKHRKYFVLFLTCFQKEEEESIQDKRLHNSITSQQLNFDRHSQLQIQHMTQRYTKIFHRTLQNDPNLSATKLIGMKKQSFPPPNKNSFSNKLMPMFMPTGSFI